MKINFILCLVVAVLVSGCKDFNDYFVFREDQKPMVTPLPISTSLKKPQRLQPPLPYPEHYRVN